MMGKVTLYRSLVKAQTSGAELGSWPCVDFIRVEVIRNDDVSQTEPTNQIIDT